MLEVSIFDILEINVGGLPKREGDSVVYFSYEVCAKNDTLSAAREKCEKHNALIIKFAAENAGARAFLLFGFMAFDCIEFVVTDQIENGRA